VCRDREFYSATYASKDTDTAGSDWFNPELKTIIKTIIGPVA